MPFKDALMSESLQPEFGPPAHPIRHGGLLFLALALVFCWDTTLLGPFAFVRVHDSFDERSFTTLTGVAMARIGWLDSVPTQGYQMRD